MRILLAAILASPAIAFSQPGEEPVVFDIESAMDRLDRVSECLDSFRALTGIVMEDTGVLYPSDIPGSVTEITLDPAAIPAVGNMEWDIQHIGFPNFVRYLRATLESQRLRIMELELRVAELEGAGEAELDSMCEAVSRQAVVMEEYSWTGWVD